MMERSTADLIAYLSSVFTLRAGDVIFTGTPEGVSAITHGDRLHAELRTLNSAHVLSELDVLIE
jgi:2-keto-4-pentenoate hydratase/2-oxohepta-3-ene-1,7-dioic acid hydratase in catechol pathway